MTQAGEPGAGVARVAGYVSVFGRLDESRDIVVAGAFARTLKAAARLPPLLWQHDLTEPIGVVEQLREDATGLRMVARIALDCRRGADAFALVAAGALTGLSFGYRVRSSAVDRALRARRLLDVDLLEISLVTLPMQAEARVLVMRGPTV